ncbi:MAG: PQQ-dependent sugar dehydrogenase, partial [Sciscionella sp.]|nr:PQQ-dependent sugar dehydrogenase [Sciscionella sp.]
MRFASGSPPTPVLTGIPRGRSGNRGALATDPSGALLVVTGDAGNPHAASDPKSLAGKVLRIDDQGKPAPGDPNASSPVVASGLIDPGGVCASTDGKTTWITDRTPTADVLYRLKLGQPLGSPAWRWPDRPGVSGCWVTASTVAVGTAVAGNVQTLTLNADGSFSTKPDISFAGKDGFGRISAMNAISDSAAFVGTSNKDGGKPVSSDDRVAVILNSGGGSGGKD